MSKFNINQKVKFTQSAKLQCPVPAPRGWPRDWLDQEYTIESIGDNGRGETLYTMKERRKNRKFQIVETHLQSV